MTYEPFQNQTVPESVRNRIMAAQLLERVGSQQMAPYTSKGVALAQGLSGALGGYMEGKAIRDEEAAQRAAQQTAAAGWAAKLAPQPSSQALAAGLAGPAASGSAPAGPLPPPAGAQTSGNASYLDRLAQVESGGNAASPGPGTSSASGLYQFTNSTWNGLRQQFPNLGLTADGKSDPAQQARAIQAFTNGNAAALGQAGFQPTPGNLYLAHFAGPGGAMAALGANPNTPVEQVLGQSAVAANPFLRGKTAGDLVGWANGKMSGVDPSTVPGGAPKPAAGADMPAPNASPTGAPVLPPGITPDMITRGPMAQDPAPGAVPGGTPGPDASSYLLAPQQTNLNPPGADAGGLGAALAAGTLPGPDSPLPGDIPTAPNMIPPNAIPNAPPDADPQMLATTDVQALPQTGPMPPAGIQTRNALAAAALAGPPGDASAMAPVAAPMAAAPAQQAISNAMSGPSPQALAAALQGGSLAPPGRGVNDPTSPQAFNQQQAAQMLAGGAPAAPAASPPPGPSPQALANGLSPGSAPVPAPAPASAALPQQAQPGFLSGLSGIFGGGQPAPALPAPPPGISPAIWQALNDPRISDATKQALLAPNPTRDVAPGAAVFDERTRQPVFTNAPKNDWHYDPQSGISSNAATGEVRQAGQPLGDYEMNRDGLVVNKRTGQVASGGGQTGYRLMTPEEKQAAGLPIDQPMQIGPNGKIAGTSGQTINVGGEQNIYDNAMSKTLAENHVGLMQGVETNRTKLRDLNAMSGALQRIQQNGGTTGLGAEEIKNLQSAVNTGASSLGLGQQYDISDKEVLGKLATQLSGAQAKDIGGARTTNFDMQQMLKANPGLELSPTGNQRMLGIAQQITQRNIDVGQAMQDAAAAAVQQGRRINPQQMESIRADYDAQHHIVDPITGQDLSVSPKLPGFGGSQGGAPQGSAPPSPAPAASADPLSQARAAIAAGAPRAAVLQRLQQMNINPAGL